MLKRIKPDGEGYIQEDFLTMGDLYREKVFINCSNHPSKTWGEDQRAAAEQYGVITDLPFPEVDPAWTKDQVQRAADQVLEQIDQYHCGAVMCQGEFTLSYAIIKGLKERGICAVAACSRREAEEILQEDGSTRKKVVFHFEGFREY